MKASIVRLDAFYEVEFGRPVFSCVASFVQIIELLYDTLLKESGSRDTFGCNQGRKLWSVGINGE